MQVTAIQAKSRFGALCAQAKIEPVVIEKDGRVDTVIVSIQQFEALKSAGRPRTLAQRQRQFEETYKVWIDEQNARFDQHGLWCDDLRVW